MSTAVFSPFSAALPRHHLFFEVDEDGDTIMTDAVTGLPITYGSRVRSRSDSFDEDDRPSKRSRSSSGETVVASPFGNLSPIRAPANDGSVFATPSPAAPAPAAAPSAPKKAPLPVFVPEHNEDGDGAESAARNLAEAMAEAVLEGEPRDGAAAVAPPGGEAAEEDWHDQAEEEGWCARVKCSDLALRLDMRHPRVVLNLLRFVSSYNELAPPGEEIHLPLLPGHAATYILSHESVENPAPEFAEEIAELRALVNHYTCHCDDCEGNAQEEEEDDYSSRSSSDSFPFGLGSRY